MGKAFMVQWADQEKVAALDVWVNALEDGLSITAIANSGESGNIRILWEQLEKAKALVCGEE